MRQILLLFLATLFACAARAESASCSHLTQVINNADPAWTAEFVSETPERFQDLEPGKNGLLEGRSDSGVMWLRFSAFDDAACNGALWLRAKYPYLTDAQLFAVDDAGASGVAPTPREIEALPFMYPAWTLAESTDELSGAYLMRIDYPDRLILPLRVANPASIVREAGVFALVSLTLIILLLGQAVQASLIGVRSRPDNLAFIVFASTAAVYVMISSGLFHLTLEPVADIEVKDILLASQGLLVWSAIEFLRTSAQKGGLSRPNELYRALQFAAALTIVAPYIGEPIATASFQFAFLLAPLLILLMLAWYAARGERTALGLLIAWAPTILATAWVYGRIMGLTPYHPINHHIVGIGLFLTSLKFNAILSLKYREQAHAAIHDSLTGLKNRRALENVAARYEDGRFTIQALAMLDLNKFKAINDTYGHSAGDQVLAQIARRVRATLPKGAEFYRIGGDEFVLLVGSEMTQLAFKNLMEGIAAKITAPVMHRGDRLNVDVSIGAIYGPIPPMTSFSRVLNTADRLAYEAKSRPEAATVIRTWGVATRQESDEHQKRSPRRGPAASEPV